MLLVRILEAAKLFESPHAAYNPFDNAACSGCQFVPICKGGCPKKVMEGNEAVMAATCSYWDKNFPKLLKEAAQAPAA